jgi:hypothetical protein
LTLGEVHMSAEELQAAGIAGADQPRQEQASKEPGEHANGKRITTCGLRSVTDEEKPQCGYSVIDGRRASAARDEMQLIAR